MNEVENGSSGVISGPSNGCLRSHLSSRLLTGVREGNSLATDPSTGKDGPSSFRVCVTRGYERFLGWLSE